MRDPFEFGPRRGRFGHMGPPGGRGRGLRGGRHGRPFDHGELRLVVLKLIVDEPRHGYDLIRALDELTGGAYSPSPGVIYPTLSLLEETELVAAVETGAKKSYAATEKGRALVAENASLLKVIFERMDHLKAEGGGAPPAEILRAMQNLTAALQVRLERGGLDRETLGRLTAVLDSAATDIERI
jgi:DNA-binding PadR family transcriptional regulator